MLQRQPVSPRHVPHVSPVPLAAQVAYIHHQRILQPGLNRGDLLGKAASHKDRAPLDTNRYVTRKPCLWHSGESHPCPDEMLILR